MPTVIPEAERIERSHRMLLANAERRRIKEAHLVVDTPPPVVSRFDLPDMDEWGPLLWERLQQRFPHLNQRSFAGWLRGCIVSNECLFLKAPDAVGLIQVIHSPLSPLPDVWEVFVIVRNNAVGDGVGLYHEFKRWTEMKGARDLLVDIYSDVPTEVIQANLGRLLHRQIAFIRVTAPS